MACFASIAVSCSTGAQNYTPNELGYIPVLMYHDIGAHTAIGGTRYDKNGLNIPASAFRKHLDLMYNAGWFPINLRDMMNPHINVPAGKIPVVLTFDDARGTQLQYDKSGQLEPDCAVAIMERFHKLHPDWPLKATFYVLPYSKYNPVPFYQRGSETRKLQYLVQQGYEVANHSTSHYRMDRMDAKRLGWEMAENIRYVKARAPGATMDTMALPMGYCPRTDALVNVLLHGTDGATTYTNLCVVRAWGGPTAPPASKKFDNKKIWRLGSEPGYIEGWIKRMKPGTEFFPFVSDGDPNTVTIPASKAKLLDKSAVTGMKLVLVDDKPVEKPVSRKLDGKPKLRSKSGNLSVQ